MRSLLFCLAFLSGGLLWGESAQLLSPETKAKLLQRLDSLEAKLEDSKSSLAISDGLIADLRNELSQVRGELKEVSSMLTDSEKSVLALENRLTTVSTTLDSLEQQLKDSQFWEWIKIGGALLTGLLIGLIL